MSTVSDLCTTIISDLNRGDTSISDTILIDIISSVREYEAQRFYFNERLLPVTVTATNTYALSLFAAAGSGIADIVEVDGIEITVNNSRTYELDLKGAQEILRRQGNLVTGNPSFYAIYNQSVLIETTPSQVLTATMSAHVKLTEIVAGGFATSNAWTNDGFELIRNATLKRLWGRKYKDYQAAQAAQVAESSALAALQRKTDALSGSEMGSYF